MSLAVEIINDLIKNSAPHFKGAYKLFNSSHHLISTISKMAKTFNWNSNENCHRFSGFNFTMLVCMSGNSSINGFSINKNIALNDLIRAEINPIQVKSEMNFTEIENGIYFENFGELSPKDRIILFYYSSSELFPQKDSKELVGGIIGVEISKQEGKFLKNQNVKIMTPAHQDKFRREYECRSWKFAESKWSKEHCKIIKYLKNKILCECTKFSHYALLKSELYEKNEYLIIGPIVSFTLNIFLYLVPICM